METIVDGYNLIFAWGWLTNSGQPLALKQSRRRLIRELGRRIPIDSRGAVTIVFDAKLTPATESGSDPLVNGFRVIFAHQHDEADSLIEEMIGRHANPKSLVVVSSDNRLKIAATRRKAIAMDSADWLDQIHVSQTQTTETSVGLSAKELAMHELAATDWLKEFQLDDWQPLSDPSLSDSPVMDRTAADPDGMKFDNPFPPGYGEDLLT